LWRNKEEKERINFFQKVLYRESLAYIFIRSVTSELSGCMGEHTREIHVFTHKGRIQVNFSVGWLLLGLKSIIILSYKNYNYKRGMMMQTG
jgi:hypothetical protein